MSTITQEYSNFSSEVSFTVQLEYNTYKVSYKSVNDTSFGPYVENMDIRNVGDRGMFCFDPDNEEHLELISTIYNKICADREKATSTSPVGKKR